MTDEGHRGAVASNRSSRTLEDAARELRALLRQQRARQREGSDARLLARLEQQAARRRAVSEAGDA